MKWDRITIRHNQCGGVPCVRALRIPVSIVVSLVAGGMSRSEILEDYPDLVDEDITQALEYAAEAVRVNEVPFVEAA